jgi:hypothetical protein
VKFFPNAISSILYVGSFGFLLVVTGIECVDIRMLFK